MNATTFAAYKSTSLGLGILTEQVSKIEQSPGGSTNSFEPIPYLKGQFTFDFLESTDFVLEAGVSMPRSSRDSALTKFNYWFNALGQNQFDNFIVNYGAGLFYTVLSMDGTTQILNNGGVDKEFQTPNSSSTASNLTLNLGLNYLIDPNFYLSADISSMNPEDSTERAFNYFISINYIVDSLRKSK